MILASRALTLLPLGKVRAVLGPLSLGVRIEVMRGRSLVSMLAFAAWLLGGVYLGVVDAEAIRAGLCSFGIDALCSAGGVY